MSVDLSIFNFIHQFAGRYKLLDFLGIFLATYLGWVLILITIVLIFKEKGWHKKIYLFSLIALSLILSRGILTEIIRFFYDRERPFSALGFESLINHSSGSAFPSGHAAFYFSLALAVYFFYRIQKQSNKWGWIFLTSALFIGIARIFVGVHWSSDILGGVIVAGVSVFVVINLLKFKSADNEITPEVIDAF